MLLDPVPSWTSAASEFLWRWFLQSLLPVPTGGSHRCVCRPPPGAPSNALSNGKRELVPVPFTVLTWGLTRMERSSFPPACLAFSLGTKADMFNGVLCESSFFKFWIYSLLGGLRPKSRWVVRRLQPYTDLGPFCGPPNLLQPSFPLHMAFKTLS